MNPVIENNFKYHAPKNEEIAKAHESIREKAKELAYSYYTQNT